ncbi:aldehyde ferredoxin oxidoreductase family protein [Desulfatibacillum aliphaticivorans]|uniref:aldehyde ferredoxin oxidoreductase family protein n=1 Tax=Desulfatibacillum aliphaticivorans TaxID=218208 RepID=UPI000409DD46|nr:aldehyde ferredoxin oxidoreductase family protein [Desulfatibacillum aliphaticivorans]
MFGFHGKILFINLESRSFRIEKPDPDVLAAYLGGKGLGSFLLYEHNPPHCDPLGPENNLIFACGPATGSLIWGGCRYGVYTKSPQTGFYSESYAGGRAPEAMDAAGYDAIVLQGQCAAPTVLEIEPGGVHFHDASNLWGLDAISTEEKALEIASGKAGKKGALAIGPAGENLVSFAVIENDKWRSAGRTGPGAVMGSKKVKAMVFWGSAKRPMADPARLREFSRDYAAESKENPSVQAYKSKGTPMMVQALNKAGAFPTRYWKQGYFESWKKISAEALHEKCRVTPAACAKCFMACGRRGTVLNGPHKGLTIEGPEYETIYAFGGLCAIDSIEEIVYLNHLCDSLGMDTITSGNLCAFAMEAVERGRVDLPVRYGDAQGAADLLRKIARREGVGDVLARGIIHAAREWGMEDQAVHVKGLEPAGYDPRVLKGMGLAYATSPRGACHLRSTFYKAELSGMSQPDELEGKVELYIDFEDRLTLFDALILCRFYRDLYPWDALGEIISITCGLSPEKTNLQQIARNIADIVRRFNLREGMEPAVHETLPKAFFSQALESGQVLSPKFFREMLTEYYRLRGWTDSGLLRDSSL